ncbi:MAG: indoleamine 2,3-dioxygenase [Myxococcota bacterium]
MSGAIEDGPEPREPLVLERFDVTAERGFLCPYDADSVCLPEPFSVIEEAGRELPRRMLTGRLRHYLRALPELDLTPLLQAGQAPAVRKAMVRYSFLVQAYVWGERDAPQSLPACLARPIVQLAQALGQQPLLPYSAYVLDNWDRFDREGPIDLSNIYMIQHFADGMDESWFVLIHVAIEAQAGSALALFPAILEAANHRDETRLLRLLSDMAIVWQSVNRIFDRMPDHCDPHVYFTRVRPYIHGWKDNPALGAGLVYDGCFDGAPQAYRGQTGSQSSIVPSMDALLGIGHDDDPLKAYLDELHYYRPPQHRAFIDRVRADSTLRGVAADGTAALKDAYNQVLRAVAAFRTRHLEYAASYIHRQALDHAGNHTDVGTGGTPFMRYLKKHRDESEAQLLR